MPVQLLRSSGRPVPQLAKELEVAPQSLRNWASQLAVDEGSAAGLSSDEREKLRRLRCEVKTLTEEREILKGAAAFLPRKAGPGECLRVHRGGEGRTLDQDDLPGPPRLAQFMAENNAVIMMVVLLLLGAKLLGDGLAGL